jgi:hypothetical protein
MRVIIAYCIAAMLLTACGQTLTVERKTYPTYGFANSDTSKSKDVCYEASFGNIVLSILLIETVIAPVYFIGWDIMNPVRLKQGPNDDCSFK